MKATAPQHLHLLALATWTERAADWPTLAAVLRGDASALSTAPAERPAPTLLSGAERRRAPETVALALQVASQAVARGGLNASALPSVFASALGDLAITDAQCATLAQAPASLSPTRFMNSVHNAASGAWGIATQCQRPSIALAGHRHSFASGLAEAAAQCLVGNEPVLLVAYDVQASGTLAQLAPSSGRLALAMVLAPATEPWPPGTSHRLSFNVEASGVASGVATGAPIEAAAPHLPTSAEQALGLEGNALADALPVLRALANGQPRVITLPIGAGCALNLNLEPGA